MKPLLQPGIQYAVDILFQQRWLMKTKLIRLAHIFHKIDRQYIQIAMFLLALTLFALGAGAPDDAGVGPR